jgi:hypothetical protein
LTFLGTLTVAGFFAAVAPLPVRADDDKDSGNGYGDNRGIRGEIAALKAQVTALQDQVTTLKTQLAAVQSNHALLLGPFVNVDPNPEIGVIGPNIIFSGANIHIVSGSGSTADGTGLGNLIIGYDADPGNFGLLYGGGFPLEPGDRGGSHNLVIGDGNRFSSSGGLVAGEQNTVRGFAACVIGGLHNTATGLWASVTGGYFNTASGFSASVTGGVQNSASGQVTGITGGQYNTANGDAASVSGGANNIAGGSASVVLGGQGVTDNNNNSIAPQPPFP